MIAGTAPRIRDEALALERPRLGFLGVGWIGSNRLAAIAHSGLAEITAIADPVEDLVEKATEFAPDSERLHTLDQLLQLELDGIVIATPSAQHASQACVALDRGVAVFCQKPLGRNLAEVRSVINSARSANRLLQVDLSYRFTAALQKIRSLVREGALGEIFAADLVFHNAYGPDKLWFYDREQSGGGCVVDLGIHLADAALWLLEAPVVHTTSRLFHEGARLTSSSSLCEDYATARLDLADGCVINLSCSWNLHAGCDASIEMIFHGRRGGAALRNVNGSFFDFTAEHFTGTKSELLVIPPDAWSGRAAVEWVRCLAQKGGRYDPEIESLLKVSAALDEIYRRADDA
jgi:predicted dehydrogenase